MELSELSRTKQKIKEGSFEALSKYVRHLQSESLKVYMAATSDHRYYQSRVQVLDDLIALLPASK